MLKLIKELFSLFSPNQRRRVYALQFLLVLMAFSEMAGVVSIGPFMALIGNEQILESNNILAKVYKNSGLTTSSDFIFWVGIGVLGILSLAEMVSMFTSWKISGIANTLGMEMSDTLYGHYLQQPWLFHVASNSAQLTNKIITEVTRITQGIIVPLLQMNSRIVLAAFLSTGLFLYNPIVAITGVSVFGTGYVFLYKIVRKRLQQNGSNISGINSHRFKLLAEGFGGIRDVLLLGRGKNFINQFEISGKKYAYNQGLYTALTQVPRYFMELIAFGSMIFLILFLIRNYEGNLGAVLAVLAVYALAGFKLLPAFQQIYAGLAQVKGSLAAFEAIKPDLLESQIQKSASTFQATSNNFDANPIDLTRDIILKNITFTYPGKNVPALNNLDMHIPVNSVVGMVGSSGSGKSTTVDILLGLIPPDSGQIFIDGEPLGNRQLRSWQNTLGFVPQSIFLSEDSIAENVAFGLSREQINMDQVKNAIKMAHLEEFTSTLPEGLDTKIGERGVQLSGGQRQRIGIARALYHDAQVLILDEATSALDGITEKLIMDAIHDFSGKKTIIMIAHRLKTVQKCDIIFFMEKGQVIDQGTYEELVERNATFKKMAMHT